MYTFSAGAGAGAVSGDNSNYIINNLPALEESANELARYAQSLSGDANSLSDSIRLLQANWQNEEGSDLESILLALTGVLKSVEEEIVPTISKYSSVINDIVTETRQNQSTTY